MCTYYSVIYSFICIPIGRNRINFIQSMPCTWFNNICVYACRRYLLKSTTFTWFFLKISVRLRTCDDSNVHVFYFTFYVAVQRVGTCSPSDVSACPANAECVGNECMCKEGFNKYEDHWARKPVCYSM